MALIKPHQQGQVLLDDIIATRHQPGLRVWWLGQSGFLIQCQNHHLLFDPYLSDTLSIKYAQTDKPHVRMTEQVIAPEKLTFIDLVTSTHNHTDHLDAATLLPLKQANPALHLILPAANKAFAIDRLNGEATWLIAMEAGQTTNIAGFEINAIPAAHEGLDTDTQGRHKYMGYIIRCGNWTIYHSGDTLLYENMEQWLSQFQIDLALLPINGRRPERRVAGNLSGPEAAQLAHNIGTKTVIPCHYNMFEFNTENPLTFVQTCQSLNQDYAVLRCGERWTSTNYV